MQNVPVDDVEVPATISPAAVLRPLWRVLGATGVAVDYFELVSGEFQLGRNRDDERVEALALGAPRETSENEYRLDCPECGERTTQTPSVRDDEAKRTVVIRCAACRTETDRIERFR